MAAHLSSGFDSSSVAATAARLLAPADGRVLAYTAAPRSGFNGPAPRGRVADESAIAGETAALHSNMEHFVLRPRGERLLAALARPELWLEQPIIQPCNDLWWRRLNADAQQRGVGIMLTGETGNWTISAGGLGQLTDMVAAGAWNRWIREAVALRKGGTVRWRGLLAASFGPWTPLPIWNKINNAYRGTSQRLRAGHLLHPKWREKLASETAASDTLSRPAKNSRELRVISIQGVDPGLARKEALATWSIDERDPTADKRLIDFCLSLPPEMLLSGGTARPLARAALADRLPRSVLYNPLRGYQFADWYEAISQSEARQAFERVRDDEAVQDLLDMERLEQMIEAWPTADWDKASVMAEYRQTVLRALGSAHFLYWSQRPIALDGVVAAR